MTRSRRKIRGGPEKFNRNAASDRLLAKMLREIVARDGLPGMGQERMAEALDLRLMQLRKMLAGEPGGEGR